MGTITQVIAVLFKGRSSETFRNRLGTDRTVMDSVTSESFDEDDDDDTCSVFSENVKAIN